MAPKIKVNEISKDFDLQVKDVTEILGKYFEEPKKAQTALDLKELDVLFDALTLARSVENFNEFFAMSKKEEKKPEVKKESTPAKKGERKTEVNKAQKPKAEKSEGDNAPKKENKKAENKSDNKAQKNGKAPVKSNENKPHGESSANPFKKKEKKNDGPMQSRTKGEVRTIDTRVEDIQLDKYNERYENIAPVHSINDNVQTKQKLKQKSQQYRKQQGMRSKKKETEAERLSRIEAERAKKTLVITVPEEITVGDLAAMLKRTAAEVIKKLFSLGMMATVNQVIDFDTAEIVATELGAKVNKEVVVTIEDRIIDDHEDNEEDLVPRSPVVCVMGHVDHGKTSLLDAIKNTSVTETEAGGITQHLGAYRVTLNGQDITFLDTPGHAAFTAMRARGAMATDIAILVVAADDGIMPQTIEAINHAKAANVQVVVAINKMDKPDASPDRVMQQLTEHELVPEEWGGDIICVPVSAKTKMGIDNLLESVLLVAEMKELKANPNRQGKGIVIEARLDKGRGPVATLLVQNGTLKTGDIIVAGTSVGRVRVMTDDKGRTVKSAGPSVPVEITGLAEVPTGGDAFNCVSDERLARELVEQRKAQIKEEAFRSQQKVTLDNLFASINEGNLKDLNIIVKADVQGSVEAVRQSLEKLSNDEVRVKVIHGAVGAINESDVMLANASNALIVGFNVRPDPVAEANAERDKVEMRMYRVIYDCIEEVEAAIKGMLAPKFHDVEMGKAEVRNVLKLSSVGTIAGSYITEGKITRNCKVRVVRDGIVIFEDEIKSLRRFKDDVKEVATGYECGIGLEKFNDIKEGDILEGYVTEEIKD
ncbi:MAG: translation initiation factor IF-2 [Oscillospiraceae bacterium]|nr:translation initiation factor IF-2 [Oscillospiraceae bacterium]